MKDNKKGKRLVKITAGLLVLIMAIAAICTILVPHELQRAASKPTEGRTATPVVVLSPVTEEIIEVQGIDWAYWQSVNPDIVAWITIPETPIDYPIVQAHTDAPTHYLDYDAYGNYNFYGCAYVDAGCTIESSNVIIFAHNMGYYDDSMFTTLTYYLDQSYLAAHQQVVIQTPEKNYVLLVRAAMEVSPYGYEKQVEFESIEGLQEYFLQLWESAPSRCEEPAVEEVAKLFTLITCDKGGATRTVVYVG